MSEDAGGGGKQLALAQRHELRWATPSLRLDHDGEVVEVCRPGQWHVDGGDTWVPGAANAG